MCVRVNWPPRPRPAGRKGSSIKVQIRFIGRYDGRPPLRTISSSGITAPSMASASRPAVR
jgi:hypothetical protein